MHLNCLSFRPVSAAPAEAARQCATSVLVQSSCCQAQFTARRQLSANRNMSGSGAISGPDPGPARPSRSLHLAARAKKPRHSSPLGRRVPCRQDGDVLDLVAFLLPSSMPCSGSPQAPSPFGCAGGGCSVRCFSLDKTSWAICLKASISSSTVPPRPALAKLIELAT